MSKTYVPTDLLNSSWGYELNDYYITIHTNDNCYNNYNNTYCDCIRLYYNFDYQYSNRYSCSTYNSYVSIPYSNLSDNIYYRLDIDKILIIFLVFFLFAIFMPYKIISRLFGRWLKV